MKIRSPQTFETLALLEEHEVLTSREISELLSIAHSTAAMRLTYTRKYNLVHRNRVTGKHWLTPAGAARLAWYRARLETENET